MFKIGKLISKNGELQWRSFREEDNMNKTHGALADRTTKASQMSQGTSYSRAMVNSVKRKELSVMTPSIAKTRAQSLAASEQKSFHMANPNPQPFEGKFKGVREMGYKKFETMVDPTDVIKFGKRVNYESKLTNDVVM